MRLEGTLDAFSLPDIFQLLSFTKKTGTLHLRREGAHGAVHLREGAVTGARADVARQELGRRLLGSGLVDDEALAAAAEELAGDGSLSLAQLLAERGGLDVEQVRDVAAEQATDAVFSLLRWADGEFAFVVDETDPDDLGASVPVEQVVTEGQRRLAAWAELVEQVPAPDAVVTVNPVPAGDPAASRDEWALLAMVDGTRTVADLVSLSGRGEYAVVSALAGLVARGLLVVGAAGGDQLGAPAEPARRARGPAGRRAAGPRRAAAGRRALPPGSCRARHPGAPRAVHPVAQARARGGGAGVRPRFRDGRRACAPYDHSGGRLRPRLRAGGHRAAARPLGRPGRGVLDRA